MGDFAEWMMCLKRSPLRDQQKAKEMKDPLRNSVVIKAGEVFYFHEFVFLTCFCLRQIVII